MEKRCEKCVKLNTKTSQHIKQQKNNIKQKNNKNNNIKIVIKIITITIFV